MNSSFLSRTFPLAATFLLLLPTLCAQQFVCSFFDSNGKPLKDVETRLSVIGREDAEELEPLFRKSNQQGSVQYPDLEPGRYLFEAQLNNYVPMRKVVTAGGESNLRRTLLKKNEFQRIEKKATRALEDDEFLTAIQALNELVEFYPEDAFLHDNLARSYAGLLEGERALAEARLAAKLDPERFGSAEIVIRKMVLSQRGDQALKSFDPEGAEVSFKELRELAPYDPVAYEGLALALGHQGKIQPALEAISKAIELDPDNPKLPEIKRALEGAGGGP